MIPVGHLEALTEIETTTQRMATAEKMTMTREGEAEAEVRIGVKGEGHEIRAETKTEKEDIDAATVIAGLRERPELTHVAVTGRGAPAELVDAADLVTEMTLIHHPFREQGVKAQAGIEF